MARVAAYDTHHTAAADDLTLVTNSFDAGFYFHGFIRASRRQEGPAIRSFIKNGGKRLSIRCRDPALQGLKSQMAEAPTKYPFPALLRTRLAELNHLPTGLKPPF